MGGKPPMLQNYQAHLRESVGSMCAAIRVSRSARIRPHLSPAPSPSLPLRAGAVSFPLPVGEKSPGAARQKSGRTAAQFPFGVRRHIV